MLRIQPAHINSGTGTITASHEPIKRAFDLRWLIFMIISML
jgi:hypothetical protein